MQSSGYAIFGDRAMRRSRSPPLGAGDAVERAVEFVSKDQQRGFEAQDLDGNFDDLLKGLPLPPELGDLNHLSAQLQETVVSAGQPG
jgi:hypothetical protein